MTRASISTYGRANDLVTIHEVVEELGISRATFYRWRAIGKGPRCIRLPGGQLRIRRSDLEQFLRGCEDRKPR